MHQKVPFTTKSLTSNTVNTLPLDTSLQFVKGVGPGLGKVFSNRGIYTVRDLLFFFPRDYQDRSQFTPISSLSLDTETASSATITISGRVISSRRIPTKKPGMNILDVRITDDTGFLSLKWFRAPKGMEARYPVGAHLFATGVAKKSGFGGGFEIIHPEITSGQQLSAFQNVGRIVPVYSELDGISSRVFRKVLWDALVKFGPEIKDDLPLWLVQKLQLPSFSKSIHEIHFPEDAKPEELTSWTSPFQKRLIFEEFFKFEFLLLHQKLKMEKLKATILNRKRALVSLNAYREKLPFELTSDQYKSLSDILSDMTNSLQSPMNRLIQGDVGSGKTAVAFLSAGITLDQGFQVALMAPTEILAEQHFIGAQKILGELHPVRLLVGKTPQSERKKILVELLSDKAIFLIGTHALIEDVVQFKRLMLIMIDEQHRFGVDQRRTLKSKGIYTQNGESKIYPHSLILTATPIPRTLALTVFGELNSSIIKEMPKGRSPIITKLFDSKNRNQMLSLIKKELQKRRQAYFIFPLVNDSEAEGFTSLKSAVTEAARLEKEDFPEFKVGLLHGQLSSEEKAATMSAFKKNEIHILVSTTVVEVGVDVPNATVIVIEHAERFGLSQLHQLRGRVGRGLHQSFCFLLSHRAEDSERLAVLEKSSNGFEISEADLKIRGPGEFLGTKQSGELPFKIANLVRDQAILFQARDEAQSLIKTDPNLETPQNAHLKRYYLHEGMTSQERLRSS